MPALAFFRFLFAATVLCGISLQPAFAVQPAPALPVKVLHKTVKVGDLDIFYREAGPKDAPAILLLHGFPTSSQMFRNLIPALADLAEWSNQGIELRAAINVSARVLQDVDFPRRLKQLLQTTAIRAEHIELEITESAMLVDPERAKLIVRELHGLGVLISIDDYGTGFSSLGYLRDLRVHALKLDKSFVVDLETRAQNRVIVESTAQMAHALGLHVVAEGVETKWVEDYLRSVGYDLAQGYLFARPMSAEDCGNWIRRERAQRGASPDEPEHGLTRASAS